MLKWVKEKLGRGVDEAEDVAFGTDDYLRDFLADLPASQPLICLHEIASVYENLMAWSLSDARRREVMRVVDDFAQRHLRVAWHMLFPKTDQATLHEQSWAGLTRYYTTLAELGARLMAQPADDDERTAMALAANQALNGMARHHLLLRLKQRPPDSAFWRRLYDLFRRAESSKVAHRKIEASGHLRGSTCGRLFARIVAFEAGPLESINPTQTLAHYHFVGQFADDLSLSTTVPESHAFMLDLAQAGPPRRARSDAGATASTRFLNVAKMQSHAQALLRNATSERALPDWLSDAECGIASYMRLLNHVIKNWSAQPPNRRHNRVSTKAEFLVCHGFTQVRRMVAAAEFARTEAKRDEMRYTGSELYDPKRFDEVHFGTVDTPAAREHISRGAKPRPAIEILDKLETAGDKSQMELWKVEDLSEFGFGALPETAARWVHVGVLVAFRQPGLPRWNLGVIRRVTANSAGRQLLGIEVFRGETAVTKVRVVSEQECLSGAAFEASDPLAADGILLVNTEKRVVMPRDKFVAGARCILFCGGNQTRVQLGDATEMGDDYALSGLNVWQAAS